MMKNLSKSTTRALRRHHAQRKFANAKRVFIAWKREDMPEFLQWIRRNADHLAVCSCYMCGHRRKWEGMTLQEKRSLLALNDEF